MSANVSRVTPSLTSKIEGQIAARARGDRLRAMHGEIHAGLAQGPIGKASGIQSRTAPLQSLSRRDEVDERTLLRETLRGLLEMRP